jgi:type II secretory pathway component PulM
MKYRKGVFFVLVGLLILWQPLAAHEQDVQAQLKDLRDLLAQQQEELAAQRILIEQLQGAQQTAGTEPHTAAVAKPAVDPTATAQQQAVEALAQQQEATPETAEEKNRALRKAILDDPSNTI